MTIQLKILIPPVSHLLTSRPHLAPAPPAHPDPPLGVGLAADPGGNHLLVADRLRSGTQQLSLGDADAPGDHPAEPPHPDVGLVQERAFPVVDSRVGPDSHVDIVVPSPRVWDSVA